MAMTQEEALRIQEIQIQATQKQPETPKAPPVLNVRQFRMAELGTEAQFRALVTKMEVKDPTSNKRYINLELRDSKGVIGTKIWNNKKMPSPENPSASENMINALLQMGIKEGETIVGVWGIRQEWNGHPQVEIVKLKKLDDTNFEKYVEKTQYSVKFMQDYIVDCLNTIREPYKSIALELFEIYKDEISTAPAAKKFHDNFANGLLEHVYKMMVDFTGKKDLHPEIDSDIVYFMIFMHDIEKIHGYTLFPDIEWTEQEELAGHIIMGSITLHNALAAKGVSHRTILGLIHIMASHHGKPEFGSPKPPVTPEAKMVHELDVDASENARTKQTIERNDFKEGKLDKDIYYMKYE